MKRFLKIALFGVACLATLILVAYQFESWRGWRAWKAYKAKVEARGGTLDPKQFIPPEIPAASNFAAIPYFEERFAKVGRSGTYPQIENPFADFEQALREAEVDSVVVSNSFLFPSIIAVRSSQPIVHHRHLDLHRMLSALRKVHAKKPAHDPNLAAMKEPANENAAQSDQFLVDTNMPPADAARQLLVEMERYNPVIDQIEGAAPRPLASYPVKWDTSSPFTVLLPHLAALRPPSQFLKVRAMAHLQAGQGQEALKDIYLIWRMADSIAQEPSLISYLVRLALINQTLPPIAAGLSSGLWNDASLAQLQNKLASVNLVENHVRAMNAESVYFGVSGIDFIRRNPGKTEEIVNGASNFLPIILPNGWYYFEMINYHQLAHSEDPAWNVEKRSIDPQAAKQINMTILNEMETPPLRAIVTDHTMFSRLLLPSLSKLAIRTAKTQTGVNLAAIACALERHRLANGNYPDNLEALGSLWDDGHIPSDVIQGQGYKYDPSDPTGYVVYSVGWDLQDDHGTVKPQVKSQSDPAEGDWAWRPLPQEDGA